MAALRRLWWVPVATVALCLGAAVLHFFLTPPVFVSNASMWETEKLRLTDGAGFTEDPETYFGTLSAVLRSADLREMVLKTLSTSDKSGVIAYDKKGNPIDVQISINQAPKGSVFTISASSSNPAFTPAYLDTLMSQYLIFIKNARNGISGTTLESISEEMVRMEQGLKADQETLADFERTNNFTVMEEENTVASGYLAKLKTDLSDYQLQSRMLDAVALEKNPSLPGTNSSTGQLFNSLGSPGSTAGARDASGSLDAERQVALLKLERDKLSKHLRPEHPKIIKLDADIERSQRLIDLYRQQSQDQIATARESLNIKMNEVGKTIGEWEAKVADANDRIATADRLKVKVARDQSLYDRLDALVQNVSITRNIDQDTLAVLDKASPAYRSYQEAKNNLVMGIFGGLAAGLAVVFLFALRDDRFASLVEVTDRFGDYVVGQVPEIQGQPDNAPLALLERNDDRHSYAESYRNLRSALLYLAIEGARPKVLLVTSAVPNEGKSTIAANLARAIALGGSSVVLIDGDLRKGQLHDLFGVEAGPGFSEILVKSEELDRVIHRNLLANFAFISRGSTVSDPGDLFLGPAFSEILGRLREQFEHVIIDSSPVFAADDAATMAPKMDGTLFVVRGGFSSAHAVQEALELLNQRQVKVLGLVYNRADSSAHSYRYYKYAEYYPVAPTT